MAVHFGVGFSSDGTRVRRENQHPWRTTSPSAHLQPPAWTATTPSPLRSARRPTLGMDSEYPVGGRPGPGPLPWGLQAAGVVLPWQRPPHWWPPCWQPPCCWLRQQYVGCEAPSLGSLGHPPLPLSRRLCEVMVAGYPVLLVRNRKEFSALGSKCPHYGAPLSKGNPGAGQGERPCQGGQLSLLSCGGLFYCRSLERGEAALPLAWRLL